MNWWIKQGLVIEKDMIFLLRSKVIKNICYQLKMKDKLSIMINIKIDLNLIGGKWNDYILIWVI